MLAAALLGLLVSVSAPPADTVVVCPREFRTALAPWIEHRFAQGHSFTFLSNTSSPVVLRSQIRNAVKAGRIKSVVLVGDAEPGTDRDQVLRARCVPAHHATAKVNIRWGSEPEIATDNWYADLDDDRLPDLAIGRLTADSPEELSRIVAKILRYEREADFSAWRRRVNFVAGLGGFGRMADAALELAAKKLITDGIPAPYASSMTYASWRSPYCPNPHEFRDTALRRLNEGCLFWVYIGHGSQRFVDWMRVPGASYPILADRDVPQMACECGSPIACFLACYTAAFDQPQDCLAEEMLRAPGGPVAIIGGSRVTMPYAMSVMGMELMEECFTRHAPTLGEVMLAAKRNMMSASRTSENRTSLDALAALVSPAPVDLVAERAEHLDLFNLIGDPLLTLRHPQAAELQVSKQAVAGEEIEVTGLSPVSGACTVELAVRRDRLTFEPPLRTQYSPTTSALAAFTAIYERANDHRLVTVSAPLENGRVAARLRVPADAAGQCHVRVYVEGKTDFAMGAADVEITGK